MALAENQITLEVVEDGNAIYTEEPASPYESGDLYVKTEEVVNGLITDDEDVIISSDSDEFETAERGEANVYVCKNDRPSGVYNPDDWQLAATDNTQLNQLKEHFWYDDAGAHVQGETTGFRNDITSTGMKIVDTATENTVAQFGTETSIRTTNGTELAHIGYGEGTSQSGGTATAPYYTFGTRPTNSTIGNYSTAIGRIANASGYTSYAEGRETNSTAHYTHAEGYMTTASALAAHAEGTSTTASNFNSHAEGSLSVASGNCSHAEGNSTEATAGAAHAEGFNSIASGIQSHAQNRYTIAASRYQTALGKYNEEDDQDTYAVIIGNGTANDARSNALTVDWNGVIDTANGTVPVFPLFDVVSVNKTFTVSANSTQNQSFAPAAADVPSGYTRVGLCGWNTANGNVFIVTCTGTTITFGNKSSSQVTCNNAQVDWLYIRSSI